MSNISGQETRQEILVRKFLYMKGFRYRKNDKRYPGKPDILIPKHKTVVFVHGCFWHGHKCKAGKLPETRKEFWANKIGNTIARDNDNQKDLQRLGFDVITIWQCELKNKEQKEKRLKLLIKEIIT